MNLLRLDHLALSAETLEAGRAHLGATIDATLSPRGEHPDMGTHNHLFSLGPETYFELISINPDAPSPGRPRWFNIDNFKGPPRLTNWIVATDDMGAALDALPEGFGIPISLKRGVFRWRMAVPDTGVLPWDGWAPAIIQWDSPEHPAKHLPDQDIRLQSLRLRHPQAVEMAQLLAPLLPRDTILFEPGAHSELIATMATPSGEVILR